MHCMANRHTVIVNKQHLKYFDGRIPAERQFRDGEIGESAGGKFGKSRR